MSKVRNARIDKDGFEYEMTREEAEDYFFGDIALEFGTPVPEGAWEATIAATALDENERRRYIAKHCYSPLVRQLILSSIKGDENDER